MDLGHKLDEGWIRVDDCAEALDAGALSAIPRAGIGSRQGNHVFTRVESKLQSAYIGVAVATRLKVERLYLWT